MVATMGTPKPGDLVVAGDDIYGEEYDFDPASTRGTAMIYVAHVYAGSRGPELGHEVFESGGGRRLLLLPGTVFDPSGSGSFVVKPKFDDQPLVCRLLKRG